MNADRIIGFLGDPAALETLYRESPGEFRRALREALETRPDDIVLRVWDARLSSGGGTGKDGRALNRAIAAAIVCGALVRVPAIWLGDEWYYTRFAPSLVILAIAFYFWSWRRDRRELSIGLVLAALGGTLASLLPGQADSVVMALIHLPILCWVFLGFVFTGTSWRDTEARVRFLRYNGELLILGSLVALGGMVFSGLTIALFQLIWKGAPDWYIANVGVIGAAAVPLAGTYLYDAVFRRRTGIASVLARVFAPLFLVMTVTYLIIALLGGQNPFVDRSFLIVVNGLLVVVLGMSVLSIAERGTAEMTGWVDRINLALLAVTLLIDLLALSAIVFRLASFGLTPNRIVVIGVNLVILVHLVLVLRAHLGFARHATGVEAVHRAAAGYLPVYAAWAVFVSFILPFIFRFS